MSDPASGSSGSPERAPVRAEFAFPELYGELRAIAQRAMQREDRSSTLRPTAVVHEVYLRMREQVDASFHDHQHFLSTAAMLMRRVLVDHSRAQQCVKRGAGRRTLSLDNAMEVAIEDSAAILEIDAALVRLEREHRDPRVAKVVEMKFFGDMNEAEIGGRMGLSDRYVRKLWAWGRAWLRTELAD